MDGGVLRIPGMRAAQVKDLKRPLGSDSHCVNECDR